MKPGVQSSRLVENRSRDQFSHQKKKKKGYTINILRNRKRHRLDLVVLYEFLNNALYKTNKNFHLSTLEPLKKGVPKDKHGGREKEREPDVLAQDSKPG